MSTWTTLTGPNASGRISIDPLIAFSLFEAVSVRDWS
jgi:hypothetical protein